MAVTNLVADAVCWFADDARSLDWSAACFHHRLVQIHPFPNGNGRHARELTDLLLSASGAPPFSWGGRRLGAPSSARKLYIDALGAADAHDMEPLLAFVRT